MVLKRSLFSFKRSTSCRGNGHFSICCAIFLGLSRKFISSGTRMDRKFWNRLWRILIYEMAHPKFGYNYFEHCLFHICSYLQMNIPNKIRCKSANSNINQPNITITQIHLKHDMIEYFLLSFLLFLFFENIFHKIVFGVAVGLFVRVCVHRKMTLR